MYKLMLVEDQPEVLRAMTETLQWEELGFQRPIACADGRSAITRIEDGFAPNVVITDICMPFVDGLELAEYVAHHLPGTLVVMLTGYDDFQYAHKALRLKVFDYVLKPITPKSLRQLATRLREELDERRVKELDELDAHSRERFWTRLLTTGLSAATIDDHVRVHKLPVQGPFLVVAADLDLHRPATPEEGRENELLRYGMTNILTELVEQEDNCLLCTPIQTACYVLLRGQDTQTLYMRAENIAQRLATACMPLNHGATCGVSLPAQSLEQLHEAYRQATRALDYRFYCGALACIRLCEIGQPSSVVADFRAPERVLTQAIKAGRAEEARAAVAQLCSLLEKQKASYQDCLQHSQHFALHVLDCLADCLSKEEIRGIEQCWEESGFYAVSNLPQLYELMSQLVETALDAVARLSEDDSVARVRKVETYIREHYGDEDLSLNTIREEFAISISYFSALFKTVTGCTFVEYVTQVRMTKARQMLTLTEKRTAEIAQAVGFADPHYFSVTFKRMIGMTPSQYRAQSRHTAAPEESRSS